MKELLEKVEKTKTIDLNKELSKIELNNEEALLLATYIYKFNVSLVRESIEAEKSRASISEDLKSYIKELKNFDSYENEIFPKYIKKGMIQAIRNIKASSSFTDLISETNLIVVEFLDKFYNKLKNKYSENDILEIFSIYSAINILSYQIRMEKEEFSTKMAILLYLKIQNELEKNLPLHDILEKMAISHEYYETLDNMYSGLVIEDMDNVGEYIEKVIEENEIKVQTFMFDYLEENLLIHYLGLEGKKAKKEDIDIKIFESILRKISETEEL